MINKIVKFTEEENSYVFKTGIEFYENIKIDKDVLHIVLHSLCHVINYETAKSVAPIGKHVVLKFTPISDKELQSESSEFLKTKP